MQLSTRQMFALCSIFSMFHRQIHGALASPADKQALDNRNSGGNTIGIDVDARAVTASLSMEKNNPSLIARARGDNANDNANDDANSDPNLKSGGSKSGSSKSDDEAGGNDSSDPDSAAKAKAKKAKLERIHARKKKIEKEVTERHDPSKNPKDVYEVYDSNDLRTEQLRQGE